MWLQNSIDRALYRAFKKTLPEKNNEEIQHIGEQAAQLISNIIFQRLSSQIEGELIEQLTRTPVEDIEARNNLVAAININRRYVTLLMQAIERGKKATKQLDKEK